VAFLSAPDIWRRRKRVTAKVMIDANPGKIGIAMRALKLAGLKPRLASEGPYNIVAYIMAKDDKDLESKVQKIRRIDGIYGVYGS